MEIADSRVGAGGQKSELTRSLLTSGIGRYQMNLELPRLRWGGEEKVKMAPPCEDSRGMGVFCLLLLSKQEPGHVEHE